MSIIISSLNTNTPQARTEGAQFEPELFTPEFQAKITQLIQKSGASESDTHLVIEQEHKSEGFSAQICTLQLGSKNIIFESMKGQMDTKASVEEVFNTSARTMDFAKEKHAHVVTVAVFTNVVSASFLQMKGLELIKKDKETSVSGRTALIMQGGVLVNIAQTLTEATTVHGDAHHQYKLNHSIPEALDWAFAGLEKELGL